MSERQSISEANLNDLIDFLNAGLEPYGLELEFAERNNASLKIINGLYAAFPDKLERWLAEREGRKVASCDIDNMECDKFINARSTAIALRNFFRKNHSMPMLENAEISEFSMLRDNLPGASNKPQGIDKKMGFGSFVPNDDQIQTAANFMLKELSDYIEFDKLITNLSEFQGYAGTRSINGFGLPLAAAEAALRATLPDVSKYDRVVRGWDVIDRAKMILKTTGDNNA